jgi:hypothetical protein
MLPSLGMNDRAAQWGATLQTHAVLAEPDALTLKRFNRPTERPVLRRDEALAGDLPAAQHVTRQAGTVGEGVAREASQSAASTKQVAGEFW